MERCCRVSRNHRDWDDCYGHGWRQRRGRGKSRGWGRDWDWGRGRGKGWGWGRGWGKDGRSLLVVVKLCSYIFGPNRVVDLHWLDRRGSDFGTLGFRCTGQEGLLSSLIFVWKERKDKKWLNRYSRRRVYSFTYSFT